MRRELAGHAPVEAMGEILGLMKATETNAELVAKLAKRIQLSTRSKRCGDPMLPLGLNCAGAWLPGRRG